MSYNDRLEEASRWVLAHPGDTVPMPKQAVAEALAEASHDPGMWPWTLTDWVRDPEHRASSVSWSDACWDASVTPERWQQENSENAVYGDEPKDRQLTHTECGGIAWNDGPCECPCHKEALDG